MGGAHPLDITIDDADAREDRTVGWNLSKFKGHPDVCIGPGMRYELVGATARDDTITFQPTLSKTGRYRSEYGLSTGQGAVGRRLVKVAHAGR